MKDLLFHAVVLLLILIFILLSVAAYSWWLAGGLMVAIIVASVGFVWFVERSIDREQIAANRVFRCAICHQQTWSQMRGVPGTAPSDRPADSQRRTCQCGAEWEHAGYGFRLLDGDQQPVYRRTETGWVPEDPTPSADAHDVSS